MALLQIFRGAGREPKVKKVAGRAARRLCWCGSACASSLAGSDTVQDIIRLTSVAVGVIEAVEVVVAGLRLGSDNETAAGDRG